MLPRKLARDTLATKKRYDRWAGAYDFLEQFFERMAFRRWRRELLAYATGNICEMGIGTGRNLSFYPPSSKVVGFDISHSMLRRLRKKHLTSSGSGGSRLKPAVELAIMDAQHMAMKDNYFDTMLATLIFCTIPEPVLALKEARRVCKPGGKLILMEHVRINTPIAGPIMDFLNPVARLVIGDNINRRTADNVVKAGWRLKEVKKLGSGIVNFIVAEKGTQPDAR